MMNPSILKLLEFLLLFCGFAFGATIYNSECGTLNFQVCASINNSEDGVFGECENKTEKITTENASLSFVGHEPSGEFHYTLNIAYDNSPVITHVTNVSTSGHCYVTICDDVGLMGYCVHFKPGISTDESQFGGILQETTVLSVRCACDSRKHFLAQNTTDDPHFDRNYVGVVYSPYDKYWEPTGPNGRLERVAWDNYSTLELQTAMEKIQKKFTNIATFGMGTASNYSAWDKGDKIGFVAKLAANINQKLRYPGIRVSLGIFRKDDVNLEWKSKELFNAIQAAKVANAQETGTVWGITVTSDYVTDYVKARDAIDMIHQVKEINARENLHLKVGIRLGKCTEFIATRRPEDDADVPAYNQMNVSANYVPLTSFQKSLHEIANITDFILCITFPPSNYAQLPFPNILKIVQKQYLDLRRALQKINPKLRLIIETGVPSEGIGNGFHNSLVHLRDYWYSMAAFAKQERIVFHMFEAVDQPWKNVQDISNDQQRFDINGPNGADAHFGWWKRQNNSSPMVYIEKITEIKNDTKDNDDAIDKPTSTTSVNTPEEDGSVVLKIVLGSFFGFVAITFVFIAYLWWKLRTARRQVISQAYIEQFRTGGDTKGDMTDADYAVALRIPYDKKYELCRDSFHLDKGAVMGSGQSGIVIRGSIKGYPGPVAFKCTTASSTVTDVKAIMSEIKILSYIGQHVNVLCILGAHTRKIERGIVYVALEYCSLGSLESFLRKVDPSTVTNHQEASSEGVRYVMLDPNGKETSQLGLINPGYVESLESTLLPPTTGYMATNEPCPPGYLAPDELTPPTGYLAPSELASPGYMATIELSSLTANSSPEKSKNDKSPPSPESEVSVTTFLRWSHQIASAMEYVSAKNVIHADLAARNVLLVSLDQVKVSDFGLSRKLYQEMGAVLHDKHTPLPWRWMAPESLKHLVFSAESDVWSFGITVWEIFSLAEVPYHGIVYDMRFTSELENGMRLPSPKYDLVQIYDQLEKCWDFVPSKRPTFSQLKEYFKLLCDQYNNNSSTTTRT